MVHIRIIERERAYLKGYLLVSMLPDHCRMPTEFSVPVVITLDMA